MNIECNFNTKIAVERQRSSKDFTIEDILSFLDRFRRADRIDPYLRCARLLASLRKYFSSSSGDRFLS
jgi:hypothetical protein